MSYYHNRILDVPVAEADERIRKSLAANGFGILTEIDVAATMKKKLGKEMGAYRILGACNPEMAFQALSLENKIGTMLPCNVIVRASEDGKSEIAAIDPVVSMSGVGNEKLTEVAGKVREMLAKAVDEA